MNIRYRKVALTVARASFDPGNAFGADHGAHVTDLVDRLCEDDIATYVLEPGRPNRIERVRTELDDLILEYGRRGMTSPLEPSTTTVGMYLFAVRDEPAETDPERRALRARLRLHHQMLRCLRDVDPTAFERLCGKILEHIGCTKVHVTQSSIDLGTDFLGRRPVAAAPALTLDVPAVARVLHSVHLLLFGQAKRYAEHQTIDQDTVKLVEPTWNDIVRRKVDGGLPQHLSDALDDIGWQIGDSPRLMFITTSSYTRAARNYAAAAQMQTLDGDQVAQLMLAEKLAVTDGGDGTWSTDDATLAAFCA